MRTLYSDPCTHIPPYSATISAEDAMEGNPSRRAGYSAEVERRIYTSHPSKKRRTPYPRNRLGSWIPEKDKQLIFHICDGGPFHERVHENKDH